MSFPRKKTKNVGGLTCKQKSFKRNLWLYKDIGGKLIIKGTRKQRKNKGTHVFLSNYYFLKDPSFPGASPLIIPCLCNPGMDETSNRRGTRHKHYEIGFGVKLKGDGISPTLGPSSGLPFVGVVTQSQVTVAGESHVFFTKKGSVPDGFAPPLHGFRAKSFSVLKLLKEWLGLTPPISLLKDVFAPDVFEHLPEISLKKQLFQLKPKHQPVQIEQKFPEGQFDYRHAHFLMGFSDLAYTIKKNTRVNTNINFQGSLRTNPSENDLDAFRLLKIKQINNSKIGKLTSTTKYILTKNGHGDIVITFQGFKISSQNKLKKEKISTELGSTMINYKHMPLSHGNQNKVHDKIYQIYQMFEEDLETTLQNLLKKQEHRSSHIYFTGHGFGGALATLAALDFVVKRDDLKFSEYQLTPVSLYTFGSPRVLNKNTFKNLYQDRLVSSYVVIRKEDFIPILPFAIELNQFVHGGQVIVLDDKIMNRSSSSFSDSNELKTLDMLAITSMNFEKQFVGRRIHKILEKLPTTNKIFMLNDRRDYSKQLLRLRYILDFDYDLNDFDDEEDIESNLTLR